MMVSPLSFIVMLALMSSIFGVHGLAASSSISAQQACSVLKDSSVEAQGSSGDDYAEAKSHYWSAANTDDTPACVAFPTNAEDVSEIVKILQKYTDVDFAMKSGGHNPNRGFSSVDGGVLISFSKLASTTYNAVPQTADVGPGSVWVNVIQALEPYGVTVVGGRIGDVGVGGLLLGCGISFLSGQYGLACDSIINYEVVLSDATIVNANATSNTDLFWALHGGGNQFGIVTKFTMKTFKIGKVCNSKWQYRMKIDGLLRIWGGTRIYGIDKSSALIDATHDFTAKYNDSKAGIIVTSEITIDTVAQIWLVFFFYDGLSPPKGVFDKFNAIASTTSTTQTQSYSSLLKANEQWSVYGYRYLIRGTTLPNLPAPQGTDLYNYHYNSWKSYVTGGNLIDNVLNLNLGNIVNGLFKSAHVYTIAFQPMPYSIPAASRQMNPSGNILDLDPQFGDHIWIGYNIAWLSSASDDAAHVVAMNITAPIDTYAEKKYNGVKNTNYEAGDIMEEEYNPSFFNDAMYDQKPLQSYGQDTYAKLKSIQQKYDPTGFFPGRTGGFKFT